MLSLADFGRALVTTGDLDPVYTMLKKARLDRGLLQRWCLAYWIYYHVGVASRVAEAPPDKFWELIVQGNQARWPRGTERRHMRGRSFDQLVQHLSGEYSPESLVCWVGSGSYVPGAVISSQNPFSAVRARALTWVGFGPWIAFKVADMCDAVLNVPIDFTDSVRFFFSEPVLGAVWDEYEQTTQTTMTGAEAKEFMARRHSSEVFKMLGRSLERLSYDLRDVNCPHASRPLLVQEHETILCKWKSYRNGHYEVGHDTAAFKKALVGWGDLAQTLAHYLP